MWLKLILLCLFGCTSSLTTSFDMSGVMSGNRMAGVPLGRSLGSGVLDVEGVCTKQGVTCQDCQRLVTCIPLPGGFLKVPLQECSETRTCNAHEGNCSSTPVPECDLAAQKFQHTCEQVGIFPDAFDCRKFHLCSPPEGLLDGRPADHRVALCPRHYGYDPRTAQCSVKLNNGQCGEKPVPTCKHEGFTAVLPSSPNHYYVCLKRMGQIYPQIFICPHGWFFWDNFCRSDPKPEETGPIIDVIVTERDTTDKGTENNEVDGNEGDGKGGNSKVDGNKEGDNKEDEETKVERTTTHIEGFFSTDKAVTHAADTFLADKFDMTNYETTDDVAPPADEYINNSFESNYW